MEKKRLTLSELKVLSESMPVLSEELQRSFIGGGDGTKQSPYSYAEYENILNSSGVFNGGYVLLNDGDTEPSYLNYFSLEHQTFYKKNEDGTFSRSGNGTKEEPYKLEDLEYLLSSGVFMGGFVHFGDIRMDPEYVPELQKALEYIKKRNMYNGATEANKESYISGFISSYGEKDDSLLETFFSGLLGFIFVGASHSDLKTVEQDWRSWYFGEGMKSGAILKIEHTDD